MAARDDDNTTIAEKLELIRKRMAEAAEAYGDDVEGLKAEAKRIGDEAGVPVELQHIDINSPETALEHLLGTASYLTSEIAMLKETVMKLSAMVIDLIEATAEGRSRKWCKDIVADAEASLLSKMQAEGDEAGE